MAAGLPGNLPKQELRDERRAAEADADAQQVSTWRIMGLSK